MLTECFTMIEIKRKSSGNLYSFLELEGEIDTYKRYKWQRLLPYSWSYVSWHFVTHLSCAALCNQILLCVVQSVLCNQVLLCAVQSSLALRYAIKSCSALCNEVLLCAVQLSLALRCANKSCSPLAEYSYKLSFHFQLYAIWAFTPLRPNALTLSCYFWAKMSCRDGVAWCDMMFVRWTLLICSPMFPTFSALDVAAFQSNVSHNYDKV